MKQKARRSADGGMSAEREVSLRTGEGVAAALESARARRRARSSGPTTAPGLDELLRAARGRRRVPRAPRARRRGRLRPGAARADGHPVHGQRRARERARDGQAQGQGDVPPPQRADAAVLRGDARRPRRPRGGARQLRLPRHREAAARGLVGRASRKATNLGELADGHRAGARLRRARRWSSASCRRPRCTSAILDGRVLGAIEVVPKSGLYDYRAKYTAGMTEYICPPRLPATRLRGVMNLAERRRARSRVHGRVPRRSARDRGRERVRPRGQHAARDDADVAPAEDRRRGGDRLRRALRGHPRRRAPPRRACPDARARGRVAAACAAALAGQVVEGDEESVPLERRAAG